MIATAERHPLALRAAAPIAWRDEARIARKLMGFAATETGSALDMWRAADLVDTPRLRRLFYRHGLDEARHALRFAEAARALCPAAATARSHEREHARRQDLYERYGLVAFTALVWRSESRALRQFHVLARHFADHPSLGPLFTDIARDEQRHVAYSRQLLDEWRSAGRAREVSRALRRIARAEAWMAWRRSGRRIGDLVGRALLATLWLTTLPLFAAIERAHPRRTTGWHAPRSDQATLAELRRQS
ncbi:MAG: ferritin-like domain-containing protein [Deltaproteobacteria bacterium]|nr:ferritin-like domain-containing protein [Deltaproteobacteria bacterium]